MVTTKLREIEREKQKNVSVCVRARMCICIRESKHKRVAEFKNSQSANKLLIWKNRWWWGLRGKLILELFRGRIKQAVLHLANGPHQNWVELSYMTLQGLGLIVPLKWKVFHWVVEQRHQVQSHWTRDSGVWSCLPGWKGYFRMLYQLKWNPGAWKVRWLNLPSFGAAHWLIKWSVTSWPPNIKFVKCSSFTSNNSTTHSLLFNGTVPDTSIQVLNFYNSTFLWFLHIT